MWGLWLPSHVFPIMLVLLVAILQPIQYSAGIWRAYTRSVLRSLLASHATDRHNVLTNAIREFMMHTCYRHTLQDRKSRLNRTTAVKTSRKHSSAALLQVRCHGLSSKSETSEHVEFHLPRRVTLKGAAVVSWYNVMLHLAVLWWSYCRYSKPVASFKQTRCPWFTDGFFVCVMIWGYFVASPLNVKLRSHSCHMFVHNKIDRWVIDRIQFIQNQNSFVRYRILMCSFDRWKHTVGTHCLVLVLNAAPTLQPAGLESLSCCPPWLSSFRTRKSDHRRLW